MNHRAALLWILDLGMLSLGTPTRPVILGEAYPGSVLSIENPDVDLLYDDGNLLLDLNEQLAFGAPPYAYQWYVNGIPVEGATDITFTVPEYANAGDQITVNNSQPVGVVPLPFAVVSASYTAVAREIANGSVEQITVADTIVDRATAATAVNDYVFIASVQGAGPADTWQFESSNPSVATVDATTGKVTHVSSGTATITTTIRDVVRTFNLTFAEASGQIVDTLVGFATGSAAANVSAAIDSRIADKHDPAVNLRIFSSQNHTTGVYVRNPNVWCADLDLTCISPWNSSGGAQRALTLISPRHVIMAAHYEAGTGCTVRFVKMDGTVVTRTMTAKLRHPEYVPYYPDITIGVLDSDVPAGITFAKVLPDDWASYLPSLSNQAWNLPSIGLDQEEKSSIQNLRMHTEMSVYSVPSEPDRAALYEAKIGGDSGNPAFLVIDNQLVLLSVWTSGGAGGGTSVQSQRAAINTMMTSLGGGYSLTSIALGAFNTYP